MFLLDELAKMLMEEEKVSGGLRKESIGSKVYIHLEPINQQDY